MKKKIYNMFIIFLCIFLLIELLLKKQLIYNSIICSLNIWVKNLIPSLFPFFIISDILINYNITLYIPNFFKKICKYLFNITDNMLTILFLSLVAGFPSGARNTRTLYDEGLIGIDEANHILMLSHFANPLFILTTIAIYFLHNQKVGIIILVSHYLGNFILGILIRKKFRHNSNKNNYTVKKIDNFSNIFINSIKKAIDTTILICGILVVFMVLSTVIVNMFNFNIYNSMLIKGFLEITAGIESLSNLKINIIYKTVISTCFLSFGGLSVHMQVISQLIGTNINYHYFFIGRVWQMIISGMMAFILCHIF